MATGESWPRAHRRPSREDAMVDVECAEWKEGNLGGSGRRRCLVAAVPSIMGFGRVGGRCFRRRPDGARCLTVCRSQCRGGVELSTQIRPLGISKKERFAGPEQKKEKWSPSRQGARQQAGPGAHHEFAPTPASRPFGQWQATISTFLARAWAAQGPAAAPRSVSLGWAATMTLA